MQLNVQNYLIKAGKLSAAESRLFGEVHAELTRIGDISARSQPRKLGGTCRLDDDIDEAQKELAANPSHEAADRVHTLLVRREHADVSAPVINAILAGPQRSAIAKLNPAALRICDDAEKLLLADCEAHRASQRKSPLLLGAETANFEAAVESAKAALAEKRRWIREEAAAAHFLGLELGIAPAAPEPAAEPAAED